MEAGRTATVVIVAFVAVLLTLTYFHHLLFTSGEYRPGFERMERLWEILYAAGVDVVLNGHDHNYQRFAPQDAGGGRIPRMASGSSW